MVPATAPPSSSSLGHERDQQVKLSVSLGGGPVGLFSIYGSHCLFSTLRWWANSLSLTEGGGEEFRD